MSLSDSQKRDIAKTKKYQRLLEGLGSDVSNSEKIQDELWGNLQRVTDQFVAQYGKRLNPKKKQWLKVDVEKVLGEASRVVMKYIDPSYDPENLPGVDE